jgi:hypothetical protein
MAILFGHQKFDGIDQTRRSKNLPYCIAKKLARQKFTINVAFLPQFSRPRLNTTRLFLLHLAHALLALRPIGHPQRRIHDDPIRPHASRAWNHAETPGAKAVARGVPV